MARRPGAARADRNRLQRKMARGEHGDLRQHRASRPGRIHGLDRRRPRRAPNQGLIKNEPTGRSDPMNDLIPLAETIAARLKTRRESIAIAESSTGGLIAAALLAVPGASAYFLGGAVAYTRQAKIL